MSDTRTTEADFMRRFINATPFGADAPAEDIQRAHNIVATLTSRAQEADAYKALGSVEEFEAYKAAIEALLEFKQHDELYDSVHDDDATAFDEENERLHKVALAIYDHAERMMGR